MVGADGHKRRGDDDLQLGVGAYNAGDLETFRSMFAPDLVGFDHRLVGLGRFDLGEWIAYLAGLFTQVRSNLVTVLWQERRGDVEIVSAVETGETNDGGEFSMGVITVSVDVGGRVQTIHVFELDAEADARAVFEELAGGNEETWR